MFSRFIWRGFNFRKLGFMICKLMNVFLFLVVFNYWLDIIFVFIKKLLEKYIGFLKMLFLLCVWIYGVIFRVLLVFIFG